MLTENVQKMQTIHHHQQQKRTIDKDLLQASQQLNSKGYCVFEHIKTKSTNYICEKIDNEEGTT